MGKWLNNKLEDGLWWGEEFDTREEAIKNGVQQYIDALNYETGCLFDDLEYGITPFFYVGEEETYTPDIDVYNIIYNLQEDARCECGDVADGFLEWDDIDDFIGELEENLQQQLDAWLERHNLKSKLYSIINIEEINAEDYL